MRKIKVELRFDCAHWFEAVGGVDIPVTIAGYVAHLQIACRQEAAQSIIDDLKQEAKDG